MPEHDWISTSEAARIAGVTPKTLQRWIAAGKVKSKSEMRGQREFFLVWRESLTAHCRDKATCDGATEDATNGPSGATLPAVAADPAVAAVLGAMVERLRGQEEELRALRAAVRSLPAPAAPDPAVGEELRALRELAAGQAEESRALRALAERQAEELAALLQALTPAPEPEPAPIPKRRPWWQVWRQV